jgi:hypothetical protein
MQTPIQLTIRSLALTVVSVVMVFAINLVPADDLKTLVLALDDTSSNTTQIEYTGIPGDVVKGQIVLQNPSSFPKQIQITLQDLDDDQVNTNGLANAANLYECCKDWIILPQGDLYTIEPNQKVMIPYEMHIPQNAEAKNYYGAFYIHEVKGTTTHCNIIKLKIFNKLSPNLGMLLSSDSISDGASEINIYSPVFAVLAALMLATGIALFGKWCLKKFK